MTFLLTLVAIYLFATGYLGYRGWRGTKTAADFLTAGGEIHPLIMALSYGATFISTSAIVGFGGAAAMFGMSLHWLTFFNIFFGIFVAFFFFGSRTRALGRRLNAHTFPELIGKRYESRGLQIFAGAIILIFMPIYTAAVLIGAANVVVACFNINYDVALLFIALIVGIYVLMGGLKGVMYTDALQGAIMFGGLLLILTLTYWRLGGVISAHQSLSALAPLATELWGKFGHRGWTAMPEFGSRFWWIAMSQIAFGVGVGVIAQPQLAVRFMTVKSDIELRRAMAVGAIFILVTVGVSYCVGPLSNLYFLNLPSRATGEIFGKLSLPAASGQVDMIIPLFVHHFMPRWLSDIFFVTLLAAAMSTISSQFHTIGAAASRDILTALKTSPVDERAAILASRSGTLFAFVLSVLIAESLPKILAGQGEAIIARGTAVFFGLCAATFLPLFVGGLYSRKITRAGAIGGASGGFAASFIWLALVKQKEAADLGICRALFGENSLAASLQKFCPDWFLVAEVDPIVVALPFALIATVAISALTAPPATAHLDKCFPR